jgi:glucosidase
MKIRLLALTALIFLCGLTKAQVNISVSPSVEKRMKEALEKALSTPDPSWCKTTALQSQRKILIEKCIKTLYHNYQPVTGAIFHEGVVPSPTTFNGLWAWDSWKHAYALSGFDKDLAENSVRAMFDYQDSTGMIADCIFSDRSENNYRDTKPPLSAWAVYEIYLKNKDVSFLKEMYPKLIKYHYWWYANRDHDRNGLCEYGSIDNTLQASRWESGWDNAIRFDDAVMLKNGNAAYSMNVESVDLNSYLYIEKEKLIEIAKILDQSESAEKLLKEKVKLEQQIQTLFFDKATGYFYDIKLEDKSFIKSKEASGWLPLYAGIATKEQAAIVKDIMMDENTFNTYFPLPTASKDNPKFDPTQGYWRGPVWIDQFYFGYKGLKNYGYQNEATILLLKLLKNGEGISDPKVNLRENYDPVTGKGLCAEMFGWTSAHLLLMMIED